MSVKDSLMWNIFCTYYCGGSRRWQESGTVEGNMGGFLLGKVLE